jgi:hypothetical protein
MDNTGQKAMTMKTIKKIFGVVACVGILAASATSVFGQPTLGDLVADNGTLTIGDKTFSGFGYVASGADASELNTDAAGLNVTASIASGIYYLDFAGLIAVNNLGGASDLAGDLELTYTVTVNDPSQPIWMIDQNYTPNALPAWGQITIAETVKNDAGATVGNSTLTLNPTDLSDPPAEPGDNLYINPNALQLFVVKDITIDADAGNLVGLSDVDQSFHEVPEPGTMLLGSLGGGLLLFLRSRRQARRD